MTDEQRMRALSAALVVELDDALDMLEVVFQDDKRLAWAWRSRFEKMRTVAHNAKAEVRR